MRCHILLLTTLISGLIGCKGLGEEKSGIDSPPVQVPTSSSTKSDARPHSEKMAAADLVYSQRRRTWPIAKNTVAVEFEPPKGWGLYQFFKDQTVSFTNSTDIFSPFGARSSSKILLSAGCYGECTPDSLSNNIVTYTQKVLSDLNAELEKPLREVTPGNWAMQYRTSKPSRQDKTHVVAVYRLNSAGGTRVFTCEAFLNSADAKDADQYEKLCLNLNFTEKPMGEARIVPALGPIFTLSPSVSLELPLPDNEWSLSHIDHPMGVLFTSPQGTQLWTGMRRLGRESLSKNIKNHAKASFDNLNEIGRAKWQRSLEEISPGHFTWIIDVSNGARRKTVIEHTVLKPGASKLFWCKVDIRAGDMAQVDTLNAWCSARAKAYLSL